MKEAYEIEEVLEALHQSMNGLQLATLVFEPEYSCAKRTFWGLRYVLPQIEEKGVALLSGRKL